MTTTSGNSGRVLIGANVIAEVTGFTVTENADRLEDTALGDTNRTYKAGLADVSGNIECWSDITDTNGQNAMTVGATVSLDVQPYGAGSGNPSWTVSADILGIETQVAFQEIVKTTFNWAAAGALTKGTLT